MIRPRQKKKDVVRKVLEDTIKENDMLRQKVALLERRIAYLVKLVYKKEGVFYCYKCKQWKSGEEFLNKKSSITGKQNYCKACKRAYYSNKKK